MISVLPSAKQARESVEAMIDTNGRQMQEAATRIIVDAISRGCLEVSIDVEYGDQKRMKMWLEASGYKVDCGESQKDGLWFVVRW